MAAHPLFPLADPIQAPPQVHTVRQLQPSRVGCVGSIGHHNAGSRGFAGKGALTNVQAILRTSNIHAIVAKVNPQDPATTQGCPTACNMEERMTLPVAQLAMLSKMNIGPHCFSTMHLHIELVTAFPPEMR
jgi:hypothetical protein